MPESVEMLRRQLLPPSCCCLLRGGYTTLGVELDSSEVSPEAMSAGRALTSLAIPYASRVRPRCESLTVRRAGYKHADISVVWLELE